MNLSISCNDALNRLRKVDLIVKAYCVQTYFSPLVVLLVSERTVYWTEEHKL